MQEFADGGQAAAHADEDTGSGKDGGDRLPDGRKVHDGQKLQTVGHHQALGDRLVEQPLEAEAQHGQPRFAAAAEEALLYMVLSFAQPDRGTAEKETLKTGTAAQEWWIATKQKDPSCTSRLAERSGLFYQGL